MNKLSLLLAATLLLSCAGRDTREFAEGRTGHRLYAFEKIDLYEIPVDTPDAEFDRIIQNNLALRMMLMLTAYNDPALNPLIPRLRDGSLLPVIESYEENEGYASVWASIPLKEDSHAR